MATVEVKGSIDEGWHVYGLQQLPGGPTPLRLTLDANDTATVAGDPSESVPQKIHDTRFGLDTQFHTHAVDAEPAGARDPGRGGQPDDPGQRPFPVVQRWGMQAAAYRASDGARRGEPACLN